MRVVLPAGLVVAFVAIVVAAVFEDSRATAPSPSASPVPGDDAAAGPRIGDHWHAAYEIFICGEMQPAIDSFEAVAGSPGTHSDGIMHQHPFSPAGEGQGSNLQNFFKIGEGKLDGDEIQIPGHSETYKNGDECPDGTEGVVQVFVNGKRLMDYEGYIPQDGDRIEIVFGPEREVIRRALTDRPARLY